MTFLELPTLDGLLEPYQITGSPVATDDRTPIRSRVAFAAAHVVADPLAPADPGVQVTLDWDATLAYRRHLWSLGLGVADAMDTAQRGNGLDWPATRELILRSAAAREPDDALVVGVTTDQLTGVAGLDEIVGAYEDQLEVVEGAGTRAVLMASRALAATARDADDYLEVYDRLLRQVSQPVVLHWLGPMFDPALEGYWGKKDFRAAAEVVLDLVTKHSAFVDGIKLSLLDRDLEVELRRRLPEGVRLYTGDDFNYPELIAGDADGHSDALLGIFDPIATVAAAALRALDANDRARYDELLAPTVDFARHVFAAPTYHYKCGIVFLAYLNGHQSHFRMVAGAESQRSVPHLAQVFRLADRAGLLNNPDRAVERMRRLLSLAGVV